MLDRVLGVAGDADPERVREKLRAFRRFVLLHGAARSWLWIALDPGGAAPAAAPVAAAALTGCLALAFAPRWEHAAPRLALPVLALQLVWTFPLADNHFLLECLAVGLLGLAGRDGRDDALVLQALQWTTAIVLFHTGLQKLLYGHYLRGDFLAFMIGAQERFAAPFAWLLPAAEVARLQSYDVLRSGAGPFRVEAASLVIVSNAVWIAEMALPVLLLVRRTRTLATAAALALVLAIQLGAREAGFALLFANLLLLFLPVALNRRLLPVWIALYAWAVAAGWGWLPGRALLAPGYL